MKKDKPIDRSQMSVWRGKQLIKPGADEADDVAQRALFWWDSSDENIAGSVISCIKFIESHQPGRINQLTSSTRLYSNSNANGFLGGSFRSGYGQPTNSSPGASRISFNLCASLTDTLVSHMAKNKVVPTFITSGGVWGMQRKAEQLTKFVEGCFYANDIHKEGIDVFRDACVWGTGILHVYSCNGKIATEKVFPHEIVIDEVEAINGRPQQLHRVQIIDRSELLNRFKNNEEALEIIRNASASPSTDIGAVGATAGDLLTTTSSWKRSSGEDNKDGTYVMCLDGQVLERLMYPKTYFPFVFYNYNKRLIGFWGQGAVERVQNLQLEINKLMILIQRAMWMGGGYKILLENGSKIVKQHMDNEMGTLITYSNTPPQYVTPPFLQAEIYPYVDALIAKGYQQEGVSQLAASSLKPAGVDSGAALRTFDQIAEDRQMFIAQELENFYLEVARQMIEIAKDIAKEKRSYKVIYPGTLSFETIDWKEIKLKEDEYVMKAFPTSSLPDDPAGKLQTVQEYMQAGLISPRAGRRLLAMPDVEMSDKLANAPENLIHKIMEDILDKEIYRAPEPFYDLTLAKTIALQYYNYADLNNAPQNLLNMLIHFMTQIDDLTGLSIPQQPMGMPGQAPANPLAPPTSPLLQNTNPNPGV